MTLAFVLVLCITSTTVTWHCLNEVARLQSRVERLEVLGMRPGVERSAPPTLVQFAFERFGAAQRKVRKYLLCRCPLIASRSKKVTRATWGCLPRGTPVPALHRQRTSGCYVAKVHHNEGNWTSSHGGESKPLVVRLSYR